MPIVVLSVREAEADKVAALDLGADDYLTKPFGMNELLARLRAALRRHQPVAEEPVVETPDFRVDLVARRVLGARRGGPPDARRSGASSTCSPATRAG